jgi:RNA polymerase sigma-70 factor (ECF subfamily)
MEELPYEEYIIRLQSDELTRHKLLKALEKLTDREKELLRLRFFEDLDYDAISLQCGITKRTAYNIIYHALQVLKADFTNTTSDHYSKTKKLVIPIIIVMLAFS